jgi:hypothetical protein
VERRALDRVRPHRGADTTAVERGEGGWIDRDVLYFSTTSNDRVWALDLQLVQLFRAGDGWTAVPFLQLEGHDGSEIAGPVFSPDGSPQRAVTARTG